MSRLSNYMAAAKLARLHINAAREADKKGHEWNVKHNLFEALENLIVAMNNVASIGFNAKPKKRRTI